MICKQSESGVGVGRYQEDFFLSVMSVGSRVCQESNCLWRYLQWNMKSCFCFSPWEWAKCKIWATAMEWKCLMYVVFIGRKNVEESWVLHLLICIHVNMYPFHSPCRNTAFPECRVFPKPALCYSLLYKKLLLHNISKPVLKVARMFYKVYFVTHIFTKKSDCAFCLTKYATTFGLRFVFIKDQFPFSECLTFLCNCCWIVVVLKKRCIW